MEPKDFMKQAGYTAQVYYNYADKSGIKDEIAKSLFAVAASIDFHTGLTNQKNDQIIELAQSISDSLSEISKDFKDTM